MELGGEGGVRLGEDWVGGEGGVRGGGQERGVGEEEGPVGDVAG